MRVGDGDSVVPWLVQGGLSLEGMEPSAHVRQYLCEFMALCDETLRFSFGGDTCRLGLLVMESKP